MKIGICLGRLAVAFLAAAGFMYIIYRIGKENHYYKPYC
nr:MAG TPA: Mid2 like cell wall stress sensor [Caudoviricetes sp.]